MLTSRQARAIIAAGEARATALGVPVNIAVLDTGAHLKAFSRMDGAVLGSIDVAMKKARTAALFQTSFDPYDVAYAQTWDVDVLWNNAGQGESGPVSEIPVDLVRHNYEVNVFKPLELTQGFIKKWIAQKRKAKIVFTSSMGGLFTPAGWGVYVSTKHALESVAEAMQQEMEPFGIKVQTINPGAYLTGYNETMADTAFRWLDDSKNFTQRAALRETFDSLLAAPDGHLDPKEMIDRMVELVPADSGKFRNVVPRSVEDMLKKSQVNAWEKRI